MPISEIEDAGLYQEFDVYSQEGGRWGGQEGNPWVCARCGGAGIATIAIIQRPERKVGLPSQITNRKIPITFSPITSCSRYLCRILLLSLQFSHYALPWLGRCGSERFLSLIQTHGYGNERNPRSLLALDFEECPKQEFPISLAVPLFCFVYRMT